MTDYEKIKTAIQHKNKITAIYKNNTIAMCPHILGTKDGKINIIFYQCCNSFANDNWRCIPLDEIKDIEICEGSLKCNYLPPDISSCITNVEFSVDIDE